MKLILTTLLVFALVSCSMKSKEAAAEGEASIELTDSDELIESSGEELALTDDDLGGDFGDLGDFGEIPAEAPMVEPDQVTGGDMLEPEPMTDPMMESDSAMSANTYAEEPKQDIVIDQVGETSTYTVKRGETLMMVAFNIYGDYTRWREIANLNSDKLINGQIVPVGTKLVYNAPLQAFSWNPEGNPYLIRSGDTLGTISSDTYGTPKYWRNIWDNNRPLIKDSNKIYAGFTIYTPLIEGRDVAAR